jgi:hypothetical protein
MTAVEAAAAYLAWVQHPTAPVLPEVDIRWLALLWCALLAVRGIVRAFRPPPRVPWRLDGRTTLDLRGGSHTIHAVVAGMSGTGKSTAVLSLLLGKLPALVVAFDNSRPILNLFQSQGWTVWQPGGTLGWDILSGSPQVVSEALTAGFAKTDSDTGYNRGLAQVRLWETLDDMDRRGEPRTLDRLVDALEEPGRNPDETRACRTWANRFRRIAKSLGNSLGPDLDLADAMRGKRNVLILPNRFLSPEDAPLVGAIALVQARRVAQEVGDFVLVVEEAGQAGSRQVEMNALAQAGRDRGCPLVVLTQNAAKLPEEVVNNVQVWISFAQESKRELSFAAERFEVEPEELKARNMPTGTAWVRAPGRSPRRLRLALPHVPRMLPPRPTPLSEPEPYARRTVITEDVVEPAEVLPTYALPPPESRISELLSKIDRSQGDCWLWTAGQDKDGYGVVRWTYWDARKPNNRPAHQVVWEVVNSRPFPPGHEWDHRRSCPRLCVNPSHGQPVTKRVNVQRMHRTRGHATAD